MYQVWLTVGLQSPGQCSAEIEITVRNQNIGCLQKKKYGFLDPV
jgi:hypothetical protein